MCRLDKVASRRPVNLKVVHEGKQRKSYLLFSPSLFITIEISSHSFCSLLSIHCTGGEHDIPPLMESSRSWENSIMIKQLYVLNARLRPRDASRDAKKGGSRE